MPECTSHTAPGYFVDHMLTALYQTNKQLAFTVVKDMHRLQVKPEALIPELERRGHNKASALALQQSVYLLAQDAIGWADWAVATFVTPAEDQPEAGYLADTAANAEVL